MAMPTRQARSLPPSAVAASWQPANTTCPITHMYYSYHSSQIPTAVNQAGQNFEQLNDPKLDGMLQQGRSTLNQQQRSNIYKNAQAYMIDQQAYQLPLYIRPNITLTD